MDTTTLPTLDTLSNQVVDQLEAKALDQAEATARQLLQRFPDHLDGLERLGQVLEARGEIGQAARYSDEAIRFVGDRRDRYAEDLLEDLRAIARDLRAQVGVERKSDT